MIRWSEVVRYLDYATFLLCIVIFAISLPGFGGVPNYMAVTLFMFVPGYVFSRTFFPNLPILETVVLIIAVSIGMSTFIQSFLGAFIGNIKISVMLFLNAISTILIAYVIVRNRHNE